MLVSWLEPTQPRSVGPVPVLFGERHVGDARIIEVNMDANGTQLLLDVPRDVAGYFQATPERVHLGGQDTPEAGPELVVDRR